jgi:hypothetical protein
VAPGPDDVVVAPGLEDVVVVDPGGLLIDPPLPVPTEANEEVEPPAPLVSELPSA